MIATEPQIAAPDVVIDEVFPHSPAAIWTALTSSNLIDVWLMPQTGFAPVPGTKFSFQTKPDGDWDGVIRCEVIEAVAHQRLVFSWKSGIVTDAGYMPRLDTLVSWTLTRHDLGTRLRLVHSGFVLPRNASQAANISAGWARLIPRLMDAVLQGASA